MLPLGNPHLSRGHEGEGKEGRREAREWILRQLSDVGEGEGKGSGVGDTRSLSSSFSWDENLVAASRPPARPPAEQSKSKKPIHKFRSPHPFLFRALCCVPPFSSPPPYDRGSDSGGGILITIAFSSSLSFHPFLLLRIQNFSSLGVSASLSPPPFAQSHPLPWYLLLLPWPSPQFHIFGAFFFFPLRSLSLFLSVSSSSSNPGEISSPLPLLPLRKLVLSGWPINCLRFQKRERGKRQAKCCSFLRLFLSPICFVLAQKGQFFTHSFPPSAYRYVF